MVLFENLETTLPEAAHSVDFAVSPAINAFCAELCLSLMLERH